MASKLYLADPKKPDTVIKTYYVDGLVSCLKQSFQRCRQDSPRQAIDEAMVRFKGKSDIKQCMPMKPIKRELNFGCGVIQKQGIVMILVCIVAEQMLPKFTRSIEKYDFEFLLNQNCVRTAHWKDVKDVFVPSNWFGNKNYNSKQTPEKLWKMYCIMP